MKKRQPKISEELDEATIIVIWEKAELIKSDSVDFTQCALCEAELILDRYEAARSRSQLCMLCKMLGMDKRK